MSDLIRRDDALAVVLLGGSPVGMSNRIAALPAVTVDVHALADLLWKMSWNGDRAAFTKKARSILAALEPVAAPVADWRSTTTKTEDGYNG